MTRPWLLQAADVDRGDPTGGGGGDDGEPAADRSAHINTIAGLHMASTVIMTSSSLRSVAALVQLLAFLPASNACFASGVCGGIGLGLGGPCMGGLGGIPPIPPPPCAGGMGCGVGYSCGAYGCYRSRARVHGAGTVHNGPVLMGSERFSRFRRPEMSRDPTTCYSWTVASSAVCQTHARHCTYTHLSECDSLIRMYFKQDACPIHATAEIQFCAAQGRDHRACCQRNGVTTTLAGAKCLTFCDQRPGNVTMLDMSYVPCYERFENMKACFWHDTVNRLKK
ncbi:DB module [Ostertagia ostertagi]